jgi:trehalose 6-phosphate phosphatase
MIHIFDTWENIVSQIMAPASIMLLFDFDGTLTPIMDRPELVTLTEDFRHLLKSLANNRWVILGIVSGRALSDLKKIVDLPGIVYAGNHGLEIEGPELSFVHPLSQEFKSTIRVLNQVLNRTMTKIKGIFVEDKGLTLSVHYRLVQGDAAEKEVKHLFERIIGVARMLGRVRTTSGKKVYEVRPAVNWDKGKAIEHIVRQYQGHWKYRGKPLIIYLGDDLTDEDAFDSVNQYHGISIYIGEPQSESRAGYYLSSIDEVKQFMEKLLSLVQGK